MDNIQEQKAFHHLHVSILVPEKLTEFVRCLPPSLGNQHQLISMSAHRRPRINLSKQIQKLKEQLQQRRMELLVERTPLSQSLSEMIKFCEKNFSTDPLLNPHMTQRRAPRGISVTCVIL